MEDHLNFHFLNMRFSFESSGKNLNQLIQPSPTFLKPS